MVLSLFHVMSIFPRYILQRDPPQFHLGHLLQQRSCHIPGRGREGSVAQRQIGPGAAAMPSQPHIQPSSPPTSRNEFDLENIYKLQSINKLCITPPNACRISVPRLVDFLRSSNIPSAVCHCMSCHWLTGESESSRAMLMKFLVSADRWRLPCRLPAMVQTWRQDAGVDG